MKAQRVPLADHVPWVAHRRGYTLTPDGVCTYTLSRHGKVLLTDATLEAICEFVWARVPDADWRRHGLPHGNPNHLRGLR